MQPEFIVARLAALPIFESVARHDLEWLVAHGEMQSAQPGAVLVQHNAGIEEMLVLIEGRVGLYVQQGGGSRKLLDASAGQVIGTIPYSRFQRSPGTAIVEEAVTAVALHRRHFPVLMRDHTALTTALVHYMLDRAREYRTIQLNDHRLQSLSRLASGFAHELNNPASAVSSTARALTALLDEEERAARELIAVRLNDEQLAAVDSVRHECLRTPQARTALEAADREEDIADWVVRHGLDRVAAESLAASDATTQGLDRLATALAPDQLRVAIRWIASRCAARAASRRIEAASARIHHLVGAMKGFTFMDREGVPEPVDIARGLADTLAMLENKARAKAATMYLETAATLPRVQGFGSEINQVWEKLIDNALDAVGHAGSVSITAAPRGESVVVRVTDDGPGIPEEIRSRIFDPFFTTKSVGQGTGLGLDLARRIVQLHRGDIDFSSQPGRTVFRVRLPAATEPAATGH